MAVHSQPSRYCNTPNTLPTMGRSTESVTLKDNRCKPTHMTIGESREVLVPGARDVRGTLDIPGKPGDGSDPAAVVVACPPHPQYGGRRTDRRLQAVSEAVAPDRACLRFDYGEWTGGSGELDDARNACQWASEQFDHVGLFGYSFGGTIALLAAGNPPSTDEESPQPDDGTNEQLGDGRSDRPESADRVPIAVSALAPATRLAADLDATAALPEITCPVQVIYGERDTTAEWEPVVDRARELGYAVEAISGDHHFVGQADAVATHVATFFREYGAGPSTVRHD